MIPIKFALAAALLLPLMATAEVHRCVDEAGKTVYTDRPCNTPATTVIQKKEVVKTAASAGSNAGWKAGEGADRERVALNR